MNPIIILGQSKNYSRTGRKRRKKIFTLTQNYSVAALLTCAPGGAGLSIINGATVIEDGDIVGLDVDALIRQHNHQAALLLQRAADKGNYHD